MHGIAVKSYEPDKSNFNILVQNSVTPQNCFNQAVVADSDTREVSLYLAKSAWNHTTLRKVRGRAAVIVPAISFKEAIEGCDCVKMDIEGAELPILDSCDFTGLKKMIVAYHVNYAPDPNELLRRIARLKTFFSKVEHKRLPKRKAMINKRVFPNEVMLYCSN